MRFLPGQFLGDYKARRAVLGIDLADLNPTVPEHEVHAHTHDDAHFLLLLDGCYLSSARGMPELCTRPALILNPPGTTHRDRFRGTSGRFFTVSLAAQDWRAASSEHALPDFALRLDVTALISGHRIWRELQQWDPSSPLVVESECQAMLAEAAFGARLLDDQGPGWLSRARERLRDAAETTPRLSDLARDADVHPVYFARAFRRRYGCSPGQYLRRCRSERAAALLCDDTLPLSQVAASCGFVDQSHLSNAFRRAYRITPSAFRRLARQ